MSFGFLKRKFSVKVITVENPFKIVAGSFTRLRGCSDGS
jgi:hypothetical protein